MFCSLYHYMRSFASMLGAVETEQDLLTPSSYFMSRDFSEEGQVQSDVYWSPQILDGIAAHLAFLMKSPQNDNSCTVTSFNHFDGRVTAAGKSSGLEDSAIKLGGRLL